MKYDQKLVQCSTMNAATQSDYQSIPGSTLDQYSISVEQSLYTIDIYNSPHNYQPCRPRIFRLLQQRTDNSVLNNHPFILPNTNRCYTFRYVISNLYNKKPNPSGSMIAMNTGPRCPLSPAGELSYLCSRGHASSLVLHHSYQDNQQLPIYNCKYIYIVVILVDKCI